MTDNKVKMHKELNEAFSKIISIGYKVDIGKGGIERIKKQRSHLSSLIDNSNYPPV